jgi:hypothetical protein
VPTQAIQRRKRSSLWLIAGSAVVLAGLVTASILLSRKEPDDGRFARLWDPKLRYAVTDDERRELLEQWKLLDPESKKRISEAMFHQAVDRFREELGQKSLDDQKAWVETEVAQMQERFEKLTTDDRQKIDERLRTDEAQTQVKRILSTYHEELSARERAVLEPMAREFIRQLETFQ